MSDENVGGLVELLPCPFCGHDDSLYVMHIEGTILHPTYYVRCDYCGAQNGATDKGNHVEQWNTRALSAHGENASVQTPMADSEMIERAAIAVFAADSGSVEAWPTATTREQDFFRRAALAALSAHGQPVVDEAWLRAIDYEISVWAGRMSTKALLDKWPEAQAVHSALRNVRTAALGATP